MSRVGTSSASARRPIGTAPSATNSRLSTRASRARSSITGDSGARGGSVPFPATSGPSSKRAGPVSAPSEGCLDELPASFELGSAVASGSGIVRSPGWTFSSTSSTSGESADAFALSSTFRPSALTDSIIMSSCMVASGWPGGAAPPGSAGGSRSPGSPPTIAPTSGSSRAAAGSSCESLGSTELTTAAFSSRITGSGGSPAGSVDLATVGALSTFASESESLTSSERPLPSSSDRVANSRRSGSGSCRSAGTGVSAGKSPLIQAGVSSGVDEVGML